MQAQLREAQETIEAIRGGGIDSLMIGPPGQEQVYSLESADRPYRLIVEAMSEGAATVSPRGVILNANPRLTTMTGRSASELVGSAALELIPAAHHSAFAALIEVSAGASARGEVELARPDGTTVPVLMAVSAFDLDGMSLRCLVLTDLTARRAAEDRLSDANAALREAEAEVRTLNAELEARVAQRTADLERSNKNLQAFTYSVSHDLRTPLRGLSGFSESLLEDYGDRLDETGRGYAGRIQAASERMATLIDDLLRLSRVSRAVMNLGPVDLSAEVAAIAEHLQAREPGRRVRFTIEDGVRVTADRALIRTVLQNLVENAWKFTARRDAATIEFGTTTAEGAGVCCYVRDNGAGFDPAYADKLFQPFERLHAASEFPGTGIGLASVAADHRAPRRAHLGGGCRRPRRHLLLHPRPEGHAMKDRRQDKSQGQLAQAQRLESLGQLAGGVAHDFNNLLAVILNYATFTSEELADATESDWAGRCASARDDLAQISLAGERAASLTRQLLAFARREVVQPRVLDLDTVITSVEELLRRTLGEHVELVTSLAGDLQPILADPGRLEQVLVNLAVNARDAMPGGGTLTIDTSNITVDADSVAGGSESPPGQHVRLRVSDTGAGMPPEVIERAFEPFFTTKADGGGTGLGLATVYGILKQADGHIHIYSEPGGGTTVSIMLPATTLPTTPKAPEPTYQRTPRGETVLVVEDEAALREVTRRILARNGYQVITAASGPEALDIARHYPGEIHLLVTDVIMPHMLGKEVAEQVLAAKPGTEVLYMSGYARPVLASQGRLEPGVALVEKPFSAADLLAKAGQVLNGHFQGFKTTLGQPG